MTFPTIHLNGTHGDDLISLLCDAMNAIQAAEQALAKAAPHSRDYCVQEPGAFQTAQDEHYARRKALHAVRLELAAIVGNLCEQQDAIAERKRGVR